MRALGSVLWALFVAAVACGGESDEDENATSAGAGKGGGAGSTAGSTGAGGSSNAAGGDTSSAGAGATSSAGAGGGGSAGGGSAGGGFSSSGEAECTSALDCRVVENCCSCFPAPAAAEVAECDETCEQSVCDARGVAAPALCRANRCVFGLNCDRRQVTCRAAEPTCPEGQIASVVQSCWGPCIAPSECATVTDCSACPAGANQVCVTNDMGTIHCVEVTGACAGNPTCACVDACISQCNDSDGIGCSCPNC